MNDINLQEQATSVKKKKSVAKGMILAAGLGSRLKPWTDTHPKALAVVKGKSLLQRNIEYLQQYGIKEVIVNVHHFADQVIEAIEKNKGWGSQVTISDEREVLLETGGGLLKAKPLFSDCNPIVLLNVDVLTDLNLDAMIGYHQEKKPLATLATTNRETSRYFLFDEGNNLCGWRNVKTGEERPKPESVKREEESSAIPVSKMQKAFSGIHIVEARIFSLIKQHGRFSIVDAYLDLMQEHTIKSFDHSETRFIDVGKPESIEKAEVMFG
ncbi:nucleotidyltransferase family protein [Segetibacter koreensis]|uniref:nucleotidyltransferase family protein n=1 Tax=Segetibacter koreensis TaxID=398037 RepID=UPI000382419E|nr:sugar phosphate nucleotidyltransferase [Segetibacter koreensis]